MSGFAVYQVRSTRMAAWTYAPDYPKHRRFRGAVGAITGVEGSLPSGWEIGADRLVDLLSEAKARWGAR